MNEHLRNLLRTILVRPFSATVGEDDLKQLLGALGAELDDRPGDRLGVLLRGRTASFRYGDEALASEEVVLLKQFLEACGVAPASAR